MIELYPKPSVFNILALAAFSLCLLFHLIAFCTNHWCYFQLNGKQINLGIWEACWETSSSDTWKCSSEIFSNEIFKGNDWHIGVRILMSISLMCLFLQEFALISYACLRKCQSFRHRLVGAMMGFSVVFDTCVVLTLLIARHNASKHPGDQVGWSYAMEIICLIFSILVSTMLYLDMYGNKKRTIQSASSNRLDTNTYKSDEKENTLENLPVPVRDNLSYRSGSYAYVSDSNLSDITVSTDVVSYSKEPGRFKLDTLEWDV